MTALSLFTGICGLDIAAELVGMRVVGMVEWGKDCQRFLGERAPGIPLWGDVREFTAASFRERTGLERPEIVIGGPPCQPFSSAGRRLGADDPRDMWPQFVRVVADLRPRWFMAENVEGLVHSSGAPYHCRYVRDLALLGYRVGFGVVGADEAVGAPMLGDRVFTYGVLAEAARKGRERVERSLREGRLAEFARGGRSLVKAWSPYEPRRESEHDEGVGPEGRGPDMAPADDLRGRAQQGIELHRYSWAREPSGRLYPPGRSGEEDEWARIGNARPWLWPGLTREEATELGL